MPEELGSKRKLPASRRYSASLWEKRNASLAPVKRRNQSKRSTEKSRESCRLAKLFR
jgi:hypothetical protein